MEAQQRADSATLTSRDERSARTIRSADDARRVLAPYISDEQELTRTAGDFFRLAGRIAERINIGDSSNSSFAEVRRNVLQNYLEQIEHDVSSDKVSIDEKREIVIHALDEMRAKNLRLHSSPEAHRAHLEIESFSRATDDLRALYEPQDGRTRPEHASHLNTISQDARDLYERGATIYGDVLSIPYEQTGKPDRVDSIRIVTHAHAVREFSSIVSEDKAKELAAEFVELGKQIAGHTADGDTRLAVFQTFYREIKRDKSDKLLSPDKQAGRIEPVFERMRQLAGAMRAEEWKRDRAEFVEYDEWERTTFARQQDAEHETHGRLTYRIENIPGLEIDEPDAGRERDDANAEREFSGGTSAKTEYERVRLKDLPPRLPEGLSEQDERQLRYELLPHLDRQIESGATTASIFAGLAVAEREEEKRCRDEKIAARFGVRASSKEDRAVTRDETLLALYTLAAMLTQGETTARERAAKAVGEPANNHADRASVYVKHRFAVQGEIERHAPTLVERVSAIETVGSRAARDYRQLTGALRAFERSEAERDKLREEAERSAQTIRRSPEFRDALEASRRDEPGAQQHARHALASALTDPSVARALQDNAERTAQHQRSLSAVAGRDIETSSQAHAALNPHLERTRLMLHHLRDERDALNIVQANLHRRSDSHQTKSQDDTARPLYVGLGENGRDRFSLGSLNEYRIASTLATRLQVPLIVYESRHGRELTGDSEMRREVYAFARDYVDYRLQDGATRMLNQRPLYREFRQRLTQAKSLDELQTTITHIRRENYDRAAHPEKYAAEARELREQGERTARHPLSESEMSRLLLAPAAAHFTSEMRDLLQTRAATSRDKQSKAQQLERGEIPPSPALTALLTEFARTKHEDPAHHIRNVRAFLGDYLNPPDHNRNRFSSQNLHELGKSLDAAERNYFFKLTAETKTALQSGAPVKEITPLQLINGTQAHGKESRVTSNDTREQSARAMRESATFRRYYGASIWRETELTNSVSQSATDRERRANAEREIVRGISERDIEVAAALLKERAGQPHLVAMTIESLRTSDDASKHRLGEVVEAFRGMRVAKNEQGQIHFQITTPLRSELAREEWQQIFDRYTERTLERGNKTPNLFDSQRRDLRRTAQKEAWHDLTTELQRRHANLSAPLPDEQAQEVEKTFSNTLALQERARIAHDARESFITAQVAQVTRKVSDHQDFNRMPPHEAQQLVRHALASRLTDTQTQSRASQELSSPTQQRADNIAELISRAITPRDREAYLQFVEYAGRTKSEYLASFRQIDASQLLIQREERRAKFAPLRDEMEKRVSSYLLEAVRTNDAASFQREGSRHTEAISRIITETIHDSGKNLAEFNLNNERVRDVSRNLVAELPRAQERSDARVAIEHLHEHQLGDVARQDHALPVHTVGEPQTKSYAVQPSALKHISPSLIPNHAETNRTDEAIEQRINHSLKHLEGQAIEQNVAHNLHDQPKPNGGKQTAHEMNTDNRAMRERVFVLVR